MVNKVSPLSATQMAIWRGMWAYEDEPRLSRVARMRTMDRRDFLSGLKWVWACNGAVPSQALVGGKLDGQQYYIGRAHHQGSVTPGMVIPKRKACCIAWGGDEHDKDVYEVLCSDGRFVPVSERSTGNLLNASSAGISEDGEPLFIGLVQHEGKLICGKVQRSHGVCYIGYKGREMGFSEYQVFVGIAPTPLESHYWVMCDDSDSDVPAAATVAGSDTNGCLYIGRAGHRGSCTPGYISQATRKCHIAWGSDEHRKSRFEYLCNCRARFVPGRENFIPVGAVGGGYSEFGEPLFIGRVQVKNRYIVGKVQPTHKVCYIPYGGKVIAHAEYEILVLDDYTKSS
ncbi:uncharacterized protein LOC129731463 [Wyeomyia smithii]|uniref:uncharacterized protein LOC129731463 n=1 Tax=Wyeomyia smithii TaxID=174621 RepID=UPI002467CCC4|nr:uncharacterized protein LOC129731463 [Wyeomyia smithii]